jgi:hypothetical protein
MKKIVVVFIFNFVGIVLFAQETAQQVMEKRAREMHRVITLNDREQWKKFVKENYSQTLIEKPMQKKTINQDGDGVKSESKSTTGTLDDKVNMFQNLHNDFGSSQIMSIKKVNQTLEMVLSGAGAEGVFKLKFGAEQPYLIEGIGIELSSGGPR